MKIQPVLAGASWPIVALKMFLGIIGDIFGDPKNFGNYASLAVASLFVFLGRGLGVQVMKFAEKCMDTERFAGLLGFIIVLLPIGIIFAWTHTALSVGSSRQPQQQDAESRSVTQFIFIAYILLEFGLGAIAAPVFSIVRSFL